MPLPSWPATAAEPRRSPAVSASSSRLSATGLSSREFPSGGLSATRLSSGSYPEPGASPPFPAPPRLVPGSPRYDPRALPIDDETLARRIAAGAPRYRPSHLFIGVGVVLLAIAATVGIFLYQGSANRARADDAARLASVFCVDEQLGNYSGYLPALFHQHARDDRRG